MVWVVAILVVLMALALALGGLALAVYEHSVTRTHLILRLLPPTYVNTLLLAVAVAIASAGTMVGMLSEDAGEALLFMAVLGALVGGASGLVLTPVAILVIGLLQRWRWRRAGAEATPEPGDGHPHPVSLTLAGCAAALGAMACLSAISLWQLKPDEWMYVIAPFVIPGGLAALGALAGRRWLGGIATLALNLLPVLGLAAALLVEALKKLA
jgi:hypothetical protein